MKFEWDEGKDRINRLKHGISFQLATKVFDDPYRIERYDRSVGNDLSEDRFQTIGSIGIVVFVVYTQRGFVTRMISARKANSKERRLYYGDQDLQSETWSEVNR